jgi:thioredoxin reductase (NADPH)
MRDLRKQWEVIILGGGLAGLSAAIYLGRAMRSVLVIDAGQSLALWEPDVQNYFGFPEGISGEDLIKRGKTHAKKYGAEIIQDEIFDASRRENEFFLEGKNGSYRARRVLLATGLLHIPPDIPHVKECLGHSMFFCKDCDGFRVQEKQVAIVGQNNDAVEYALGMVCYSSCVAITTNGKEPHWDKQHAEWISEYEIPVYFSRIVEVEHKNGSLKSLAFEDGRRLHRLHGCSPVDQR